MRATYWLTSRIGWGLIFLRMSQWQLVQLPHFMFTHKLRDLSLRNAWSMLLALYLPFFHTRYYPGPSHWRTFAAAYHFIFWNSFPKLALELAIFLPQFLEFRDYRYMPLCLVSQLKYVNLRLLKENGSFTPILFYLFCHIRDFLKWEHILFSFKIF